MPVRKIKVEVQYSFQKLAPPNKILIYCAYKSGAKELKYGAYWVPLL